MLSGEGEIDEKLIAEYDQRRDVRVADDKYAGIEVEICDVKEIQNTTKGVSGFWLRAMLSNKNMAAEIHEKDRAILAYLADIRLELHEHDNGFTLYFDFDSNAYFNNKTLTKKYHMSSNNVIERCEGCEINWTAGSDPTKTKKKKKQKKGGKKVNVTVTVKCESFFNFFESIDAADEKDDKPKGKGDDSDDGDHEHQFGEKMDQDLEIGNCFKDDLIPLGLEYYLGVIEQESDGDDDDIDGMGDSDEEDKAKKPKKGSKKDASDAAGAGGAGEQKQECKQ